MNDLPKMFCITLKNTPDRKKYAENQFLENGLDVTFFEGIDGKKFGLNTNIPYMDDVPNWKPCDGSPYYISQGHVGCILSHYMLWNVLKYLSYDKILIFEDDVILNENFKENLLKIKSNLPDDWQYVFVGHCCCPDENNIHEVSNGIYITNTPPMCTHAYMIKKESIETLIETNSMAWSHIDIQIQKLSLGSNGLKYYVCIPPLADQISINNEFDNKIFKSLT